MLGNLLILLAVLYVTVYCFMTIARSDGIAPEIKFINTESYLSALGFSVYCFEGVGIVMPIMQSCEDPHTFKTSLNWAIFILTVIYIIFGSIGYLTWGQGRIESYSTEMLPADNTAVILMKLLFSINIILSYPLAILPTNEIFG